MTNETLNPLNHNIDKSDSISYSSVYLARDTTMSTVDLESEENPTSNPSTHHHKAVEPTKVPRWICELLEPIFKINKRKTTIEQEIYCGLIQFISCLYVLPVVPFQMKRVGYIYESTIVSTSATCCIGSIAAGFITNMPFIIAPPTSVSIFLAVSMQQSGLFPLEGNGAVMISGAGLTLVGLLPPLSRLVTKFIPDCIQASTAIGIGLITALAGATEIHLVVHGKYTILDMGVISPEVVVAICSLIIVAACLHYHVKGAFCMGLFFGTFVWWLISEEWPKAFAATPYTITSTGEYNHDRIVLLVFNLLFLYILTLNGLARGCSDLAGLTKKTGAVPRGNWLLVVCGLTTILSGYLSGPPILISPESAAGIKAGAKTGLSTLVCGICFGFATFLSPIFAAVPAAGTAPLLIMVGVLMFSNVKRIDWTDMKNAVPAYCVLFFIPFTYSILRGVAFGYVIYISLILFTGEYISFTQDFANNFNELIYGTKKPTTRTERSKSLRSLPIAFNDENLIADDSLNSAKYSEETSQGVIDKVLGILDMKEGGVTVGLH